MWTISRVIIVVTDSLRTSKSVVEVRAKNFIKVEMIHTNKCLDKGGEDIGTGTDPAGTAATGPMLRPKL